MGSYFVEVLHGFFIAEIPCSMTFCYKTGYRYQAKQARENTEIGDGVVKLTSSEGKRLRLEFAWTTCVP